MTPCGPERYGTVVKSCRSIWIADIGNVNAHPVSPDTNRLYYVKARRGPASRHVAYCGSISNREDVGSRTFRADRAVCEKLPGLYLALQRHLPFRCTVSSQAAYGTEFVLPPFLLD